MWTYPHVCHRELLPEQTLMQWCGFYTVGARLRFGCGIEQ